MAKTIFPDVVCKLKDNQAWTNANEDRNHHRNFDSKVPRKDFSIDQSKLNTILNPYLLTLCNEAIAVNSTAFEDNEKDSGECMFISVVIFVFDTSSYSLPNHVST